MLEPQFRQTLSSSVFMGACLGFAPSCTDQVILLNSREGFRGLTIELDTRFKTHKAPAVKIASELLYKMKLRGDETNRGAVSEARLQARADIRHERPG
jgi:hypothetical protein